MNPFENINPATSTFDCISTERSETFVCGIAVLMWHQNNLLLEISHNEKVLTFDNLLVVLIEI